MTERGVPEFQSLFEAPGLPRSDLPDGLARAYGDFGLAPRLTYGNFVSSIDGIVALPGVPRSSSLISGGEPADRFVVALLRAFADAVVIGAGTFRAHDGPWTSANAFPEAARDLVEVRERQGASGEPTLVVVTASGDLGGSRTKLEDVVVITTSDGAVRLDRDGTEPAKVVEAGAGTSIDLRDAIGWLSDQGYERILIEGGPKLMGEALASRLVEELFLTISPVIAGGGEDEQRPTLASGVELLPDAPSTGRLLNVRRHDAYLFLRYGLAEGPR